MGFNSAFKVLIAASGWLIHLKVLWILGVQFQSDRPMGTRSLVTAT